MSRFNGAPIDPNLKGVKGWLLFLCINLAILSPLIRVYFLATSYAGIQEYMLFLPRLRAVTIVQSILSVGIILFCIYAGIGLWMVRPGAVGTAKLFLLVSLGYGVVEIVLQYISIHPFEPDGAWVTNVVRDFIRAAVTTAIWYAYLHKSTRVRETYGP